MPTELYISSEHIQIVQKMDIVWDSYNAESLKAHMRENVLFTGNCFYRHLIEPIYLRTWGVVLQIDFNKTQ